MASGDSAQACTGYPARPSERMTPSDPSDPAWGTRTGTLPRSTLPGSAFGTPALHGPDQRLDALVDAAEAGVEVRVGEAVRVGEHRARRATPQPEQRDLGPRMRPAESPGLVRLHRHQEVARGGAHVLGAARGAGEQLDAPAARGEHRDGVGRRPSVRA